jgi:hypothetical protein
MLVALVEHKRVAAFDDSRVSHLTWVRERVVRLAVVTGSLLWSRTDYVPLLAAFSLSGSVATTGRPGIHIALIEVLSAESQGVSHIKRVARLTHRND